jgi:hypothetical protein
MVSFIHPEAFGLILLLILPQVYQYVRPNTSLTLSVSSDFASASKPFILYLSPLFLYLGLFSMIVALARPVSYAPSKQTQEISQSILMLIDLSGSMEKHQATLQQALEYSTRHAENAEIAWVGFASDCYMISPFTSDKAYLLSQTKNIDSKLIGTGKTALGDAMLASMLFFKSSQVDKKLLIFSDGICNDGKIGFSQAEQKVKSSGIDVKLIYVNNSAKKIKNVYKFPTDSLSLKQEFLAENLRLKEKFKKEKILKFKDLYIYCIGFAYIFLILHWYFVYVGVDNVWKE